MGKCIDKILLKVASCNISCYAAYTTYGKIWVRKHIQDLMVVDSTAQISTSVLSRIMNVTRKQTVQIRMEPTTALAILDTRVMVWHALVST